MFEKAAVDNPDIVFAKVDTDAEPGLSGGLGIRSIPTLMAFRDGIPVFRQAGALPPAALTKVITAVRGLGMEAVRRQEEETQPKAQTA